MTVEGKMLWFNEEKGRGEVESDGERIPVERADFARAAPVGRCAELPVRLKVIERGGRRVATEVAFVEGVEPRRARSRRPRMG